jgi:phosphoribosyl-AMP cyclohydrolase
MSVPRYSECCGLECVHLETGDDVINEIQMEMSRKVLMLVYMVNDAVNKC